MILFLGFFGDFRGREPDLNCKFKLNFPLDDFGAENLTKIIKKMLKKSVNTAALSNDLLKDENIDHVKEKSSK